MKRKEAIKVFKEHQNLYYHKIVVDGSKDSSNLIEAINTIINKPRKSNKIKKLEKETQRLKNTISILIKLKEVGEVMDILSKIKV